MKQHLLAGFYLERPVEQIFHSHTLEHGGGGHFGRDIIGQFDKSVCWHNPLFAVGAVWRGIGDPVSNSLSRRSSSISDSLDESLRRFPRQALHATALSFIHPYTGEESSFSADLPADYKALLAELKAEEKTIHTE